MKKETIVTSLCGRLVGVSVPGACDVQFLGEVVNVYLDADNNPEYTLYILGYSNKDSRWSCLPVQCDLAGKMMTFHNNNILYVHAKA